MSWPDPPLERSLFNVDPLDEFSTVIADWIWHNVQDQDNVEIEAKLGTIVDMNTGRRVELPVMVETIVDLANTRFESNMDRGQHAHFNGLLNILVSQTNDPSHKGSKVHYARQNELDLFYTVPGTSDRIRVTRDEKTSATTSSIVKRRIADLNIYSPRRVFDYRISINTETPVHEPGNADEHTYLRRKNRVSYTHEYSRVDLTLVESDGTPSHELEVEMIDVPGFLAVGEETRRNTKGQQWTPFEDRVLILLNNIRMLIRYVFAVACTEPWY